ncbi:MAG: RNA methyltransferase [Clostridia bacterium]|nr:RNA methyltransferase [Clostridia bacterium]
MKITSTDNARIKYLNSLKKKSVRDREKCVFLEGENLCRDSARFGAELTAVFVSESYTSEIPPCEEVFELSERVFLKVAETQTPQGIIAVAKMPELSIEDIKETALILCDDVRDPGNMGTIIRTAHAVGASVALFGNCVDIYNLKTVRSSMGSVFAAKCVQCDTDDIKALKSRGYKLFSGMLHKDSKNLYDMNLQGNVILAVGNEANGIGNEISALSDAFVTIPMPGGAESLNAAVSASVMLYEYLRQNQ